MEWSGKGWSLTAWPDNKLMRDAVFFAAQLYSIKSPRMMPMIPWPCHANAKQFIHPFPALHWTNRHTRMMCGKKLINNSPFTFALINIVRNRELVKDDHDAVNTQQNTADDRPTRGVCWHNRLSGYNSPMTPR